MILIAGTVPFAELPLISGQARMKDNELFVEGHCFPCTQGTAALISATLATTQHLGTEPPHVLVAGDIGRGGGSRLIYDYLRQQLPKITPDVLAMHYILPDMAQMRSVCDASERCEKRPIMVADAASMYAAKAAGIASRFDVFTPDIAELGFLADPEATHPAYISEHLFNVDNGCVPDLIRAAYEQQSAPGTLLVKGKTDYIVKDGRIFETVFEPQIPALEAVGGTGDTITGILVALLDIELEPSQAAVIAAKANRMAGRYAHTKPATTILQIIERLPAVLSEHLCTWSGVCCIDS